MELADFWGDFLRLVARPSADRIGVAKPNETNPIRRRPEAMIARTAAKMRAHLDHFLGSLSAGTVPTGAPLSSPRRSMELPRARACG